MDGIGTTTSGIDRRAGLALLVLPVLYVAACVLLRHDGGPFWIWHLVDPSYYYLFDSLNLALLEWPGHPYHPGTPVQVLGAVVLRLAHPLASSGDLVTTVLDDPEGHLRLISSAIVGLVAALLLVSGLVTLAVTRNLALALVMEAGPFLSKVTLKNAYHVKPEPMLIAVMLVLGVVTLLALRPGILERKRNGLAVLFGLIAGFGVATKLTAAPVFLFPLFLLGGLRPVLIYGAASLAAVGLFTLPIWGSLDKFASFAAMTLASSGAYGSGEGNFVDLATYPGDALKIFKRPILFLPVLLSLGAVVVGWRRRASGRPVPEAEWRALGGVALAVTVHVLAVAKQPTANYMVPSYMLAPLFVVLFWRFVAGLELGSETLRRRARLAVGLLLVAGIAAQGFAVARLDRELVGKWAAARTLDEEAFDTCTKIDFFPAATPAFALLLGDWWTGSRFADEVAARVPAGTYWFEQNTMELRDAHGPVDGKAVIEGASCVRLRGGHRGPVNEYLSGKLPGLAWRERCRVGEEFVFTLGIACSDKVSGDPR